jgi:hypothetical protein
LRDAGAVAAADADLAALSALRTRSLLLTACLPRVDIALRRASAATRAELLETAPAGGRVRGAAASGAGAGALT